MLTIQQKKLLVYLHNFIQKNGICPSFEEMSVGTGLKSKSNVHRLLDALVERGFVRRLKNRGRAVEVIRLPGDMQPERPATITEAEFPTLMGLKFILNPAVPDDEIWVSHNHGKNFQRFKVAS